MNRDRMAARLLATFVGELDEQVASMNANLLALEADPDDPEVLRSLFRVAHTLKGAARAAAVPLIEETCHALESLLARAREGSLRLGREHFALLFSAADALGDAGVRLRAGTLLEGSALALLAAALRGPPPGSSAPPPSRARAPHSGPARASPARSTPTEAEAPPSPERRPPEPPSAERLRVHAEKVDALLAVSSELLVASARSEARPAQARALSDLAVRCAHAWRRIARRARANSGAHPAIEEANQELDALVDAADRLATEAADDARSLGQVVDQLTRHLRRLRMGAFAEACALLPRTVRDLAVAGGKEVQLEVVGGELEADRAVLDGLREALLHLVRNAVDHGIEAPPLRTAAGKPPAGTITLAASLRGERLVVTVTDDGAGLDVPEIRRLLGRRGEELPADDRQLARLLFQGGVSTRTEATEISGRGVGLDAARAAIERIRGRIDVSWISGHGATFTLECPLTLAMLRVLLVRVDGHILAFPTESIERLERVRPEEIRRAGGRDVLATPEEPVPLVSLAQVLGPPFVRRTTEGAIPVVRLVAGDGRRLAVAVDELIAEQEVMLRPLDDHPAPPLAAGAALLGSGEVALVLAPDAVVAQGLGVPATGTLIESAGLAGARRRRILVADDSITTRSLEESVLEAAGYEVQTAADGADAWRLLQDQTFDLVVSDVEMPRMDGFALCEAIRGSRRLATLPIILVSALESPEHRRRGLESGADAYIAKSSFDQQELTETVLQLIGRRQ